MNTFMRLAKEGKIGHICKRGAWIILALGTLQVALQIYASWNMYRQMQQNPVQGGPDLNSFLMYNVSYIFESIIGTIFYFLILYTAGTIINSLFVRDKNDDDVTIEPLKNDDDVTIESREEDEVVTIEK
jgi:hypothetical protein